ncbi:MAG: type II secretion system secretin GspD [Gammaproteobacteria bacterium]
MIDLRKLKRGRLNTRVRPPRASSLIAACVGALCLLSASLGLAQQGPQLTPNYRDADIRVVAEQVAQVIGRTIIVDPRVRAQVTVLSNAPMSPPAFYRLFQSVLEVHGFVALDSGDALQIVPDANARFGAGSDYVTQAIVLENIAAAQLVPILRPLLPQSAHLAAHPTSNSLIVADRPQNIQRILTLIRRMDQAGTEDVEVVPLENAGADDIVRMMNALNQAAQAAGGTPPIQVISDPRTNSVLLAGTGPGRLRYRALIAHLDTPTAQGGNSLVRYLNYADAEDLATKLQAQFGAAGGSGASGGGGVAKPGAAPEGANSGPVTIWADAGTNALVINAPERIRQDMMAVVNQIDIPRLQVQVDAIIVEITESKAAQIGTTWLLNGADSNKGLGITNFSSTTGSITQLAASGSAASASAVSQGLTAAIGRLRDGGTSWVALLNALRGDADTNVVSTPQIVTLDNEEAEIKVGQQVPFVTGQFTNTGSTNAGTVNPFQTIQRQEVGTKLKITPQINEGSGVKLKIEQETSSISAGATGAVDLVTNNRTISTSVFVHDGDMLILGGLIDDQMRNNEQRVPGLGRIPGLGWLFRARKTERTKTNLMVFIRPVILHDEMDARFQTNSKYSYVQELQRQMNESNKPLIRGDRPEMPPFPEPLPAKPSPTPAPAANGSESK